MSTRTQLTQARLALARRLAILRRNAGYTQAQAARMIHYSRSAVARAEATGICSRDFCRQAGHLYGAGDDLAHDHDHIQALTAAARAETARASRQARHADHPLPPAVAAPAEETEVTFTAVEAPCPSCGKPVAVLIRQTTALLPVESPQLPS
jgi:hypothetical protein